VLQLHRYPIHPRPAGFIFQQHQEGASAGNQQHIKAPQRVDRAQAAGLFSSASRHSRVGGIKLRRGTLPIFNLAL
jgi:hypothetical protein